jgi:5-methylcytosine-specific restriction endonuclease McrA
MTEQELETIHEYLFDRYDKLVLDVNNPSILKQDDNDKKFNIIKHFKDNSSNGSKTSDNISYICGKYIIIKQELNITKKEYYDKYILENINQIYKQYKIYYNKIIINKCTEDRYDRDDYIAFLFINELLKGIKKDEEQQKLDNQQKLEEQKKLEEKQKLDKQKKLEEENVKLKQELQKQSITKPKLDNNDKKKKKPISATIKRLVWNTNIGEQIGKAKCMCCNVTDITQMSFNCGHIIAESNGGETIVSNLKPICQNCNSSMGTKDMEEFIKTLK